MNKEKSMIKAKTTQVIVMITMMFLFTSDFIQGGSEMDENRIFTKGNRAPDAIFTNTVWVNMLHTDEDGAFDTQVYDVIFEPSARTFWHSHPGGQILLATSGTGYYQEKGKPARLLKKGDVVANPPEVEHWHGAAPDRGYVHNGMITQVHL
ncbi:MAG: cupin domain-containing protein [Mangrovibacterium sp.]